MQHGYQLFDTVLGRCAVAWSERGVVAVQLPEARDDSTRARIVRRCPDAKEATAPPAVAEAIRGIVALFQGQRGVDLSFVAIDWDGVPPFHRRVYEIARTIAPGQTVSYGEIAVRLGSPGCARAVGQALGRNPFAIIVPCHRVLAANGDLGGFSAHGGIATKLRILTLEGAAVVPPAARRARAVVNER